MSGSDRDKRREERVCAVLPVNLGNASGLTCDVSASGIFFETAATLAVGEVIDFKVEFDTPAGKWVLKCRGTIVRTEERDNRLGVAAKIHERDNRLGVAVKIHERDNRLGVAVKIHESTMEAGLTRREAEPPRDNGLKQGIKAIAVSCGCRYEEKIGGFGY